MALFNWAFLLPIISLAIQLVHGMPAGGSATSSDPPHIFRRQLPTFSNFATDGPGTTKTDDLTQAFRDMVTVVNKVLNSDAATYNTIFAKYFQPQHQAAVKAVFQNMVTPATNDPSTGADIFNTLTVDANDYLANKPCGGTTGRKPVAYTNNYNTMPTTMHFCDTDVSNAYAYPKLSDLNCGALDSWVSVKMLSFGGYLLLHELSHFNAVSQAAITPFNQPDNEVGDYAYGPSNVRLLLARPDATDSAKVVANADSYAWFATEVYWSNICGHGFGAPQDNVFVPGGVCPTNDCVIM